MTTLVGLMSGFVSAMSLELEAKFRVESHGPLRTRLGELGATLIERVTETNWIFDRPDGWLRERGRGLRLRSRVTESGEELEARLTVKGPRQPGPLKSRDELEFEVGDADVARKALEMMGYVPILEYQKRRESWTIGDGRVELDEPPHIGLFVEIEAPCPETIRAIQKDLNLGDLTEVQATYVQMLLTHCREHGPVNRRLHFP